MVRKLLVIDDHPLVFSALQALVRTLDPAVDCCSAPGIGPALDLLAAGADIDLVLLDLTLDDAVGMQGLAALRAAAPQLPVVVLSAHDDLQDVVEAVDLGAMGYISKRTGQDELVRALGIVMGGGVYIPAALMQGLQAAARPAVSPRSDERPSGPPPVDAAWAVSAVGAATTRAPRPVVEGRGTLPPGSGVAEPPATGLPVAPVDVVTAHGLTPRQAEVLQLLLRGLSNKLIARELGLSVETVKDHVAAVLRALGVSSRTQAVLVVSRHGQGVPAADGPPRVGGAARLR